MLGVGHFLRLVHNIQIYIEVILECVKNDCINRLRLAWSCPQEAWAKILRSLFREIATPFELALILFKGLHERLGVFLPVCVGMEQWLHVQCDQMTTGQCDKICAKEWQVVVEMREDDIIQHLKRLATLHMCGADLSQFGGAVGIRLGRDPLCTCAFTGNLFLAQESFRDRVWRQILESFLHGLVGVVPELGVDVIDIGGCCGCDFWR
mmetsp:Transcript_43/g.74  ORF Transcript_43/g.74 Transcript_43/m.74 type:complete len:208 (-) Transcript_43:189-812(-)